MAYITDAYKEYLKRHLKDATIADYVDYGYVRTDIRSIKDVENYLEQNAPSYFVVQGVYGLTYGKGRLEIWLLFAPFGMSLKSYIIRCTIDLDEDSSIDNLSLHDLTITDRQTHEKIEKTIPKNMTLSKIFELFEDDDDNYVELFKSFVDMINSFDIQYHDDMIKATKRFNFNDFASHTIGVDMLKAYAKMIKK